MIGETGERKSAVATPDGKSRKKKKKYCKNDVAMPREPVESGAKSGARVIVRFLSEFPSPLSCVPMSNHASMPATPHRLTPRESGIIHPESGRRRSPGKRTVETPNSSRRNGLIHSTQCWNISSGAPKRYGKL